MTYANVISCYAIDLTAANDTTPCMRSILNERGVWVGFEPIKPNMRKS